MEGDKYTNIVLKCASFQALDAMKNVTITLDERTAAWARVYAARNNISVSRLVGEMLQQRMRESHKYEEAMRRFLSKEPIKLNRSSKRYPKREEVHARSRLR